MKIQEKLKNKLTKMTIKMRKRMTDKINEGTFYR